MAPAPELFPSGSGCRYLALRAFMNKPPFPSFLFYPKVSFFIESTRQMQEAIANHRKLEAIVQEMREITQTLILETVPGVPRKKPISKIPKAR